MEENVTEKSGTQTVEEPVNQASAEVAAPAVETLEVVGKQVEGIAQVAAGDDVTQNQAQSTQTSYLSWEGMGDRIGNLLGFGKAKVVKIPSVRVQRSKVTQALKKEIQKLSKKAERMLGKKGFSADLYEQTVLQIRQLRAMLLQVYDLAKDVLEQWYRQYVLKLV